MAYIDQVQDDLPIRWSVVEPTPIALTKLQLLTQSHKSLLKEGYILTPLEEEEIWRRMRCQNCGQKMPKYRPLIFSNSPDYGDNYIDRRRDEGYKSSAQGVSVQQEYAYEVAMAARSTFTEKHHCFFHDGQQFRGVWQCCGGRFNTKGCCSNINHIAGATDELKAEWSFRVTPGPPIRCSSAAIVSALGASLGQSGGSRLERNRGRYTNSHSSYTNEQSDQSWKSVRSAVALDCEMGISRLGDTVLIRLSLIDFFTQESLIDSLVYPSVEMAHYNTRYSGVTFGAMKKAVRARTAIQGADAARHEVFKFVDSNTIVIAHGGNNDFKTLKWIHPATRIIDACVLETYDHKVKENGWKKSLKEVCRRRCGILVQNARLNNGRAAGHDSLEDAFATREVVCWWLKMIPDQ